MSEADDELGRTGMIAAIVVIAFLMALVTLGEMNQVDGAWKLLPIIINGPLVAGALWVIWLDWAQSREDQQS